MLFSILIKNVCDKKKKNKDEIIILIPYYVSKHFSYTITLSIK
jgi:hypothetical protein